jgi:hypothetical protein
MIQSHTDREPRPARRWPEAARPHRARRSRARDARGALGAAAFIALFAVASACGWANTRVAGRPVPPAAPTILNVSGSATANDLVAGPPAVPSLPAGSSGDAPARPSRAAHAPDGPGLRPTAWYRLAARDYGISPQLLEALHHVESSGAGDSCVANRQGSGAIGPFQFKPSTFARIGVDANHDGKVDICGFADSLFSAASYLRTIGADADPASAGSRRALARYGTDVNQVVSLALAYRDRDRG